MGNFKLQAASWPLALSLLLATGVASAQSTTVGATGWKPPWEMDFRIYGAYPASAFAGTWASSQDVLLPQDVRFAIDEACVTWSRVTGSRKRCRATGVGGVAAPAHTGSFWQNNTDTIGFNFHDKRNGVYFAFRGPNDIDAAAAMTECELGLKDAEQCDIWFMINPTGGSILANDDTPWSSFINPADGPPGTALQGAWTRPFGNPDGNLVTAMPGAPTRLNFHQSALHEVGHALGLWHTIGPGPINQVDCDAQTYHCPVMTGGTLAVSYWPQIDDFEGMRDAHGLQPRELEWSVWSINDVGEVVVRSSWNSFNPPLYSETPPRIACTPEEGSRKGSCVMAIGRPGTTPRIRALSLSDSGFTVTASPVTAGKGTRNAEGAVDISYGSENKYLAIAKRTPRDSAPTAIVTYAGNVGSPELTATLHRNSGESGFFTHTEPRISYHETSCHFVAAWPERNGAVHVATFDLDGILKDDFLTRVHTRTPVELACDAHLPSQEPNCRLYVKTNDGSAEDRNQQWQTFQIRINDGGAAADSCHTASTYAGRGMIIHTDLGPEHGTWSGEKRKDALLIDSTTYGNGAEKADLDGGAYLLTSDVAPFSNMGQDEVKLRIDRNGESAGDISVRTLPMTDTGAVGLSNTTTWGWNEPGGRLIAVRTARMK